MDLSSLLGTVLSADSLQSIGAATNTKPAAVQNVLSASLPSLISGAQTQNESASTGFADAVLSHGKNDTSDLGAFLSSVDLSDGRKIVGHLLGSDSDSQISSIAQRADVSKKDTANILSAAAPLLMSLLGQQSFAEAADDSSPSAISAILSLVLKNVDVGSLLSGLLGENTSAKPAGKKNSLLSTLLGKLFGKN